MSSALDLIAIKEFWNWFLEIHNDFGSGFENSELIAVLDKKITRLGKFDWEIGPGLIKANQLIISPNGDLNKLELTREIISYAINLPDWEFNYVRPPKQWKYVFNFKGHSGPVQIDASDWKYVLLKYEDGMLEVIIQTHDIQQFDDKDKRNISEILIDGVLGEETRMLWIYNIEIVDEFEKQYISKAGTIKNLNNHINSILNKD